MAVQYLQIITSKKKMTIFVTTHQGKFTVALLMCYSYVLHAAQLRRLNLVRWRPCNQLVENFPKNNFFCGMRIGITFTSNILPKSYSILEEKIMKSEFLGM